MGKKTQENNVFQDILDIVVSVYMLLLIVVMPLYFQEGYSHIGTDKATFFRECSTKMWYILVPLIVFGAVVGIIVKSVSKKDSKKKAHKAVYSSEDLDENDAKGIIKKLIEQCKQIPNTYLFAGVFVIALLLSYACSAYKEDAVWGANGWFMGLIPQLLFVGIYVLVAKFWSGHKWIAFSILPVSFLVFLLGYLNRFSVYPIDMKVAEGNFLSTIGNINWFCGYIVSVFFIGFYLLWNRQNWKMWQQVLLSIYVLVGFAILVVQGSASGMVALAVVLLVTFCMSVSDGQAMENFLWEIVLLAFSCLMTWGFRQIFPEKFNWTEGYVELLTNSQIPFIMTVVSIVLWLLIHYWNKRGKYPKKVSIICGYIVGIGAALGLIATVLLIWFNTTHSGVITLISDSSVFIFSPEWGSKRGATWSAGWMCFAEQDFLHKLVGVGPDCMSAYLYDQGSVTLQALVKEQFHTAILTNAHNEWLTVLVNIGIVGAAGYIGMIISAIIRFLKNGKECPIIGACGLSMLAVSANNMFSFQQSMGMATIFVIFGIGECYYRQLMKR